MMDIDTGGADYEIDVGVVGELVRRAVGLDSRFELVVADGALSYFRA